MSNSPAFFFSGLKTHCRGLFLALIMVVEAKCQFVDITGNVYSFKGFMPKGDLNRGFAF